MNRLSRINWQERLNQLLSTGKSKSYFTVGVTILFIVVMSIVGIVPAVSSLSTQIEDNVKRDALISKLDGKLSDLKNITLSEDEKRELVDYFNSIMPEGIDQQTMVNVLKSIADKNSVFISTYTFDKENIELIQDVNAQIDDRIFPVRITLSVSGTKESILSFLRAIENSAYIFDVNDFTLSRNTNFEAEGTISTNYSVSLKLLSYYYKNKV